MDFLDDARTHQADLARLRRALHQNPEIGLELPRTQERVLAALDGLPVELTPGPAGLGSVTAVLRGGRSSRRSVLLRGDMDALPVAERPGWTSPRPTAPCTRAGTTSTPPRWSA